MLRATRETVLAAMPPSVSCQCRRPQTSFAHLKDTHTVRRTGGHAFMLRATREAVLAAVPPSVSCQCRRPQTSFAHLKDTHRWSCIHVTRNT